MSTVLVHHDERFFPDSTAFIPERWLDCGEEGRKELERGLLAFSRGGGRVLV
ncbi:hypothetical protein BJX76DRAFT_341839 [Aspergillus varians]